MRCAGSPQEARLESAPVMKPLSRLLSLAPILFVMLLVTNCGTPPPTAPDGTGRLEPVDKPEPPSPPTSSVAQYGLEHVGFDLPGEEVCDKNTDGSFKNPIAEGTYKGILRNAKCDQQKFVTMAYMAQTLGVKCNHCHAPDPSDPKKEAYPVYTDNKRVANWMYKTFIQGLRPNDGSKMLCKSCHVQANSDEPLVKILKKPRDQDYAQEWMHEVLTTKFVEANGKRLKCRTCHVGMAPDTKGWIKNVIRRLRYDGEVKRRDDVAGDAGE
jgi:hypothetical protein